MNTNAGKKIIRCVPTAQAMQEAVKHKKCGTYPFPALEVCQPAKVFQYISQKMKNKITNKTQPDT